MPKVSYFTTVALRFAAIGTARNNRQKGAVQNRAGGRGARRKPDGTNNFVTCLMRLKKGRKKRMEAVKSRAKFMAESSPSVGCVFEG